MNVMKDNQCELTIFNSSLELLGLRAYLFALCNIRVWRCEGCEEMIRMTPASEGRESTNRRPVECDEMQLELGLDIVLSHKMKRRS